MVIGAEIRPILRHYVIDPLLVLHLFLLLIYLCNIYLIIFHFSYSAVLVRYPSSVVCITFAAVIFSIIMGVVQKTGAKPYPDFSDPLKVSGILVIIDRSIM